MSDSLPVYACRADVYEYGLPVGTLGAISRSVESVNASTDTLECDGHGFESRHVVTVRVEDGGTMPAPLVSGAKYYVIRVDDSHFQLSERPGYPAINLTTAGASLVVVRELPFEKILEYYSRWIDALMPAHAVPFEEDNVPSVVRVICAELAARKLQSIAGHASAIVGNYEMEAKAKLERFASGLPLRDSRVTRPTNLAVVGSRSSSSRGTIP